MAVKVIPVELTGEIHHALAHGFTLRSFGGWTHVVEVSGTALGLPVVEKTLLDDLEVLESLRERRPDIVAPVSGAIADHSATKVDLREIFLESSREVVLVDLPGKVGHVDSTV